MYSQIRESLESIFEGEKDFIANAANFSSMLYHNMENINWAGFYLKTGNDLILGPFHGKPACIRIPIGKGVCGKCALDRQPVIVQNVHEFSGHIACDSASNSEIVLPVIKDGYLYGVLDIDSPVIGRFGEEDRAELEKMLEVLIINSNLELLKEYYK